MRWIVFLLVFSTFPILIHFIRTSVLKAIYGTASETVIKSWIFNVVTLLIGLVPLCVAVFYPQIATILSYVGAVCGLIVIYILPVLTYLVKFKTECDNPMLARAHEMSLNFQKKKLYAESPSIKKKLKKINELDSMSGYSLSGSVSSSNSQDLACQMLDVVIETKNQENL